MRLSAAKGGERAGRRRARGALIDPGARYAGVSCEPAG